MKVLFFTYMFVLCSLKISAQEFNDSCRCIPDSLIKSEDTTGSFIHEANLVKSTRVVCSEISKEIKKLEPELYKKFVDHNVTFCFKLDSIGVVRDVTYDDEYSNYRTKDFKLVIDNYLKNLKFTPAYLQGKTKKNFISWKECLDFRIY